MGASDDVIRTGSGFARVMLGMSGTVLMLFLINSIFRGTGDAAIAMRVLWFANAINITLGPCLIFGLGPFPELGVKGTAVATSIGRGSGVLFQLYHLTRGGHRVAGILRLSGVGMFQNLIATSSWVGLVRILTGFGSAAVAGNTIGIRIIMFALLPSFGVSNAAATLVGQNLGAGKPDRAEAAAWRDGVRCLRIVAAGFLFYGYGMVLTQSFNGAGDTWTATFIHLGCLWCLEIPLAWVLAYPFGWGPTGIFVAVSVAFSALALVSATIFRQGGGGKPPKYRRLQLVRDLARLMHPLPSMTMRDHSVNMAQTFPMLGELLLRSLSLAAGVALLVLLLAALI
jgi:Na+-driven multidrug efflux pump